tara:strand:- start:55 stop:234 length:180 start_codon:yes stop_codon:yes gene_type:complete
MKILITQRKSTIGAKKNQRDTIKALGLNKIGKSVEKDSNEMVLGMIETVRHLVEVSEIK